MGKFQRSRADSAMRKTLSSTQSLDDSLLLEAAAKAFIHIPPVTGANAIPLALGTSTPSRDNPLAGHNGGDEAMPDTSGEDPSDFQ